MLKKTHTYYFNQLKFKLLLLIFVLIITNVIAQTSEKITFPDSKNYYYQSIPKANPLGIIFILPGGGETADRVKNSVYLDDLAVENNYIVIIPSWEDDSDFYFSNEIKFMDRIAKDIVTKYNVSKDKISIGGLSGGGMLAIKYTEIAIRDKNTYFIPKSIYALDPPLDYANMYYRLNKDIERNYSDIAVNEAKYFLKDMTAAIGIPDKNREKYIKESMYSYREKDGGNAKYLMNIPILIYIEPGILWQMENRGRDLYDLNCTDITAMINLLKLKGHKNADLVITNDRGIRPEGIRHPHSWSIMDPIECLAWITKHME